MTFSVFTIDGHTPYSEFSVAKSKVAVFIDGSSFYFGLKRTNRVTRVDYYALGQALVGPDRELDRIYYFNSAHDPAHFPDQAKAQQPFLDSLDKTPYLELRLGRIVPTPDGGSRVRGMAPLFAAEFVYRAAKRTFDVAVVIGEDTDYASVISHAKELGVLVEVAMFRDSQPRELLQAADLVVPLDAVLDAKASDIFLTPYEPQPGSNEAPSVSEIQKKLFSKAKAVKVMQ